MIESYKSKAGHVSIVIDYQDGKIQVLEANYVRCRVTTRWEKINSRMRFYKPNDPVVAYFNAIAFIRNNNIK